AVTLQAANMEDLAARLVDHIDHVLHGAGAILVEQAPAGATVKAVGAVELRVSPVLPPRGAF
ncbi:hypothetical protein, partial [Herbaspirillum sp. B65]|uniref:hypothetical protein n=1 Tax=Herbaspirillum sp. B65 TaxID=137708 RepID=UPI0005C93723